MVGQSAQLVFIVVTGRDMRKLIQVQLLQVLSDDDKRPLYDQFGEAGVKAGAAGPGAGAGAYAVCLSPHEAAVCAVSFSPCQAASMDGKVEM